MNFYIFVYGTLKRGYGNNERILYSHPFVSEGVVQGYKAYNCGFPIARTSPGDALVGEIYDIEGSNSTLTQLDRLESEGYMYHRKYVDVITPVGILRAQMYVGDEKRWDFDNSRLSECPKNADGHYVWPPMR